MIGERVHINPSLGWGAGETGEVAAGEVAVGAWGERVAAAVAGAVGVEGVVSVYVAGPMRGVAFFNAPAFDAAAVALRGQGFEVCNPAEMDRDRYGVGVHDSVTGSMDDIAGTGFDVREALAADLTWIARHADVVAVLPGWRDSAGARVEVALAHALGLLVVEVDSGHVVAGGVK